MPRVLVLEFKKRGLVVKKMLLGLFLFGILFAPSPVYAEDENGVEVVTEPFGGGIQRKRVASGRVRHAHGPRSARVSLGQRYPG